MAYLLKGTPEIIMFKKSLSFKDLLFGGNYSIDELPAISNAFYILQQPVIQFNFNTTTFDNCTINLTCGNTARPPFSTSSTQISNIISSVFFTMDINIFSATLTNNIFINQGAFIQVPAASTQGNSNCIIYGSAIKYFV